MQNPDPSLIEAALQPCQKWAKKCLHGAELVLGSELSSLLRQGSQAVTGEIEAVKQSMTRIQADLAQFDEGPHDSCRQCPAPIELGSPYTPAQRRCALLQDALHAC